MSLLPIIHRRTEDASSGPAATGEPLQEQASPEQRWGLNLDRRGPVWTWFEPAWYGRHDAAASRAASTGAEAALEDYHRRGAAMGFAPNIFFDPVFYLASDANAAASVEAGEFASAYEHYRLAGWPTLDPHWLFKVARYGSIYKELIADAETFGGLYGHYLGFGAAEGRSAHPLFDTAFYLAGLPADDAAQAAAADPFGHFLRALDGAGADGQEPRASVFFDAAWYRANYRDAERLMLVRQWSALRHYLCLGVGAGLDPLCDFSEPDYLALNPTVAERVKRGLYRNGYDHYLEFGAFGLRSPNREVDLGWYAAQPSVTEDLESGLYVHAFAHLLLVGIPKGLPLAPPPDGGFALQERDARAAFLANASRSLPALGRHRLQFGHAGAPAISVVMVLRNQFALTMQTLSSLRSGFPGPIQLLLVDNDSTDDTRSIDDLIEGATLLRQTRNIGFLRACNLALDHVLAPVLLFMNNDIVLHPGALQNGMARLLGDDRIGAVGGKILRTHGLLQEAGSIVWRDGSTMGYLRDQRPDTPSANFVRDVDFCSGAFLMARTDLVRRLGGLNEAFAPAYYEEVDLCLAIQAAGMRVVYDPDVAMTHFEYASARSPRAAVGLMERNRSVLRARHAAALTQHESDTRRVAAAANRATAGRRLLMFEDVVPLLRLGSGLPRAADAVRALVALGWQVTIYPMQPVRTPLHHLTQGLPETVEILWDRNHTTLDQFLEERRDFYDVVWVSRAHNLHLLQAVMRRSGTGLGHAKLILDTEAVFSCRNAARGDAGRVAVQPGQQPEAGVRRRLAVRHHRRGDGERGGAAAAVALRLDQPGRHRRLAHATGGAGAADDPGPLRGPGRRPARRCADGRGHPEHRGVALVPGRGPSARGGAGGGGGCAVELGRPRRAPVRRGVAHGASGRALPGAGQRPGAGVRGCAVLRRADPVRRGHTDQGAGVRTARRAGGLHRAARDAAGLEARRPAADQRDRGRRRLRRQRDPAADGGRDLVPAAPVGERGAATRVQPGAVPRPGGAGPARRRRAGAAASSHSTAPLLSGPHRQERGETADEALAAEP